jgi:hypothetical protein
LNIVEVDDQIVFSIRKSINYIKSFYIYTDIIESNEISPNKEKLIQIIKLEGEFLETNVKSFTRPSYSVVNRTYLNTINISIFDQNRNIVQFEESPVIKLHFIKTK